MNEKPYAHINNCNKDENACAFQDDPIFEIPYQSENQYTYTYKHEAMKLIGRESEMQALHAFAEDEHMFRWTMIIGAAGTGKSRLALEFAKERNSEGWNVFFFNENLKDRIRGLKHQKLSRNTLVIFDYTFSYASYVSDYLYEQCKQHSPMEHKLRVLLVDRDYQDSQEEEKAGKDVFDKGIAYAKVEKSYPILARHETELKVLCTGTAVQKFGLHLLRDT